MNIPDYDDFYSLTDYASQFFDDTKKPILIWLNSRSTISLIELREMELENGFFRKENVPYFIEKISKEEKFSPSELISALGLNTLYLENDNLSADKTIYYDFVQFLTQNKMNVDN